MRSVAPRILALIALSLALAASLTTSADAAASHAQITGSGSSWSANAVNQWVADVSPNGLQVVFTSTGSAQGRKDFTNKTTDYAVTDIGYQGVDKATGDSDSNCQNPAVPATCRNFVYLPIVAGGTSFPYQLKVAGKLVRNLRLSGQTLAKIFTNQITNWSDPAITADMNGKKFPSLPIIVVVHSEGSGSTAQFTRYLDKEYPSLWRSYFGQSGSTEYYPRKGQMIAQNGSDGVINFLTSAAANGSIGYDEYSYALAKNYPVAKIENSAGFYTLPTQYNVAVALTQARICGIDVKPSSGDVYCQPGSKAGDATTSPQYLLQNLDKVYTFNDKRTYPMSSYSYMLIPTASNDPRMTTPKRQTLADFLYYSVCQGQAEMGPIGYSPLPINLVQASFNQVTKLKSADANVDLTKRNVTTCNNPTFVAGNTKVNHLAQIAPLPPACDKAGSGPCTGNGDTGTGSKSTGGSKTGTTGTTGTTGSSGTQGTSGTPGTTGTQGGSTGTTGVVNPDTGQVDPGSTGSNGTSDVTGTVTEVAAYRASDLQSTLAPVVALEMIALLALPPLVYFLWVRRRRDVV